MEKELKCSFYRNSKSLDMGLGIGLCDLDGAQSICNGDLHFCEKPSTLNLAKRERKGNAKDRRTHPRIALNLPLEYREVHLPNAHGALIVNGSEVGLLIQSIKDIPVGVNLNLSVIFQKKYELANADVLAQVVRKELFWKEDWEGYHYGLKFIQIGKKNHWRLRQLLSGQYDLEELLVQL